MGRADIGFDGVFWGKQHRLRTIGVTHIDDLADAWFLELRLILRPEEYSTFSIHDNNTIARLNSSTETRLADRGPDLRGTADARVRGAHRVGGLLEGWSA